MSEGQEKDNRLWHVRRGPNSRGPFTASQIARFVILGRIAMTDELSPDQEDWRPLSDLPALIPAPMREGADPETLRQLRQREDERHRPDRRESQEPDPEMERRRAGERRRGEAPEMVQHREQKTRFLEQLRERSKQHYKLRWAGTIVVLLIILVLGVRLAPQPETDVPDCNAAPGPGVNWNNCRMEALDVTRADLMGARIRNARLREVVMHGARLDGADLAYTELIRANLSYARLAGANLKGANLRQADLAYADLTGADLSYSDLSEAVLGGAVLDGARFDNAVWPDGRLCAPGSVGECRAR